MNHCDIAQSIRDNSAVITGPNRTRLDFLNALNEKDRNFMAIVFLITQVNNGGFQQWVTNSYYCTVNVLTDALRELGTPTATLALSILEKALHANEIEIDHDRWEALDAVDAEFYSISDELTDEIVVHYNA